MLFKGCYRTVLVPLCDVVLLGHYLSFAAKVTWDRLKHGGHCNLLHRVGISWRTC